MAIQSEALLQCLRDDISNHLSPSVLQEIEESDVMWPDISLVQAYAFSLRKAFLKKFDPPSTVELDKLALEKFLDCNRSCENWELPCQYDTKTEILLGELKRAVYEFWNRDGMPLWDHPYDLLSNGKLGPGANRGARGGSFYAKLFSSPLSCSSSSLYFWYSRYIKSFPEWSSAEIIRREHYGSASITESSRLSFVPKNDKISRCICTEPTLNTMFQLGAGHLLEKRLSERFGISLPTQQFKNRNLARLGSITDGLSTIDLSSASDSISVKMLRWLLPFDFFNQLMLYRCKSTEIKGRGTVPLAMVSTMGNGYTFPLQTMIFACVVVAALRFRGIPWNGHGSDSLWGVNGDDIIVPSACTEDVISLLTLLGFSVNNDKSFVKGPFRESCGADFFLGSDIRGVYLKRLDTMSSRYVAFNLLAQFSTKSGIPLRKTLGLLRESVQDLRIPLAENIDAGIRTPLVLSPTTRDENGSTSYEALVPIAKKCWIKNERIVVPRSCKPLIYNPPGLLISFLQRSVSFGSIAVRDDRVRYRKKRRVTPFWEWYPTVAMGDPAYGCDWQRWKTVVLDVFERSV